MIRIMLQIILSRAMDKISKRYAGVLLILFVLQAQASVQDNPRSVTPGQVSSQDTIVYTVDDNFALFDSNEILNVNLELDLTSFLSDRFSEEYIMGVISFRPGTAEAVSSNVRVRSRGNRRLELCSFPPIRLNFRMKGENGENIVTNLKLVSHCFNSRQFETYLFREYMAYRMFNIITDKGYRVRLLRINYIDTGRKKLSQVRYAFAIEPSEVFAYRTGTIEIKDVVVRPGQVDPDVLDRVALFQYMIGNDDWNLTNLHNLKAYAGVGEELSKPFIVPYDYDYSGFVNTHYAVPNPDNPISSVHERIYLGPCRSEEKIRELLDHFLACREQILQVVDEFPLIENRRKGHCLNFIESFYDEYTRDRILSSINRTCTR